MKLGYGGGVKVGDSQYRLHDQRQMAWYLNLSCRYAKSRGKTIAQQ